MTHKKSFVLYENYYNQFAVLPMEERGELITAIFEYHIHGVIGIPLSPVVEIAFSFIKDTLDRDREAYEARCERNRSIGKLGGRPKKTQTVFSKPDNDNENDIENDIDNGIDIDNDMGFGSHPLLMRSAPTK